MHKLTVLIIFIANLSIGQTHCDSLPLNLTTKYSSYSQKRFSQLQHKKNLDNTTAYEVSTYLRQKNDTTYKQWYLLYIDLTKKMYDKKYCDKGSSPEPIFYTGVAYYYTDNFEQAYAWFIKAIKSSYSSKCLDYYYELTKNKLGK